MVLRSTSPKAASAREPRAEGWLPAEERDAGPGERSHRAMRDGAAGPRELHPQKNVVGAEVALHWVLQEIVQQARLATTATGAFIAVVRSHKFVCQAGSGSNAGEFVNYLNRDRRMADSCLRTGAARSCRDAEAFEELEGNACRYLGARSVVLVPILDESEERLGVFGVFSPQAEAFSSANLVALQSLSRRIADTMAQVERCVSALSREDASGVLRPSRSKSPARAPRTRRARRPLTAVLGRTVWGAGVLAIVVLVAWPVGRSINLRTLNLRALHASAVETAPAAGLQPGSLASAPVDSQPVDSQLSSSVPVSASPGVSSDPAPANPQAGVVAVVKRENPAAAASLPPSPATAASQKIPIRSRSLVPDLEIENALDDATSASLPQAWVGTPVGASKAPGHPAPSQLRNPPTAAATPQTILKTMPQTTASNQPQPDRIATSIGAVPSPGLAIPSAGVPPREAAHFTISNPPSVVSTPVPAPPAGGTGQSASPLDSDSSPAPPVMLQEWSALSHVAKRVPPAYPPEALAQRTQGTVVLDVVVTTDGQVESVTPVEGDHPFVEYASKAVRKWRFTPFLHKGQPVRFESHITLNFVLP